LAVVLWPVDQMQNHGVNLQAVIGTVLLTGIVLFVLGAVARRRDAMATDFGSQEWASAVYS
jgi:hypothetical protein